jgi:hypothetical protein
MEKDVSEAQRAELENAENEVAGRRLRLTAAWMSGG